MISAAQARGIQDHHHILTENAVEDYVKEMYPSGLAVRQLVTSVCVCVCVQVCVCVCVVCVCVCVCCDWHVHFYTQLLLRTEREG